MEIKKVCVKEKFFIGMLHTTSKRSWDKSERRWEAMSQLNLCHKLGLWLWLYCVFFLLFFLVKRFYWFFISFSVKQSSRMVESSSDTHTTTKHIILGCSLGIIFILCVSCFIINKRGWNIRIINDSESVESGHDSQPERSPILCVDTVINANQPCTSRWKSKEKTDHICSW